MSQQYTKGKWVVSSSTLVCDKKGRIIADTSPMGLPLDISIIEALSNACRICQCVNGWDELEKRDTIMVETLAEIKAKIEGNPEQVQSIKDIVNGCIEELAAITAAEKGD